MDALLGLDRIETALQMNSDLPNFLAEFPLKRKWLDEIIEFLLSRPDGTAHVSDITRALEAIPRDVSSVRGLVCTTLGSFCSDRRDFDRAADFDLFARLALGTYQLRSFPHSPDTLEIQRIEFHDKAMTHLWREFSSAAQQQIPAWPRFNNRERLIVFTRRYQEDALLRDRYESWWSRYRRYEEACPAYADRREEKNSYA